MLPLFVIFEYLRELYPKQSSQKAYQDEFICYIGLHLSQLQI